MIRGWLKSATANVFCKAGIDKALRSRNLPVVVAYHRVVEDFGSSTETSNPSMLVSRQMLERHLDWIGRRYRFVDLNELGTRLESSDSSKRVAAITFDDGYQDFYDHALPLLRRKGIPAAIFVSTDYVGTKQVHVHDKLYLLLKRNRGQRPLNAGCGVSVPDVSAMGPYLAMRTLLGALPLDRLQNVIRALESEDPLSEELLTPFRSLSWETLNRVRRSGVTVGSHTRSHVLMTNETSSRATEEAAGSREEIRRHMPGSAVEHFAYPSGLFNATSIRAVATAGYKFGYTACPHRSLEHPLLTVPRTLLWEKSSLDSHSSFSGAVLDCQIQHAFAWIGGCRQGHELGQESGR
jgi:peptidoglycan/xylan/chitin deacetylase (PgdA/CDA1 family)